jgi:hypothetical protein
MPSVRPIERKNHAPIVHLRTDAIHASSSWPEMSAAMPNAYGMLMPTKPVYSDGGCVTMYAFWSSGFSPLPVVGMSVRNVSNGFLWKMMT